MSIDLISDQALLDEINRSNPFAISVAVRRYCDTINSHPVPEPKAINNFDEAIDRAISGQSKAHDHYNECSSSVESLERELAAEKRRLAHAKLHLEKRNRKLDELVGKQIDLDDALFDYHRQQTLAIEFIEKRSAEDDNSDRKRARFDDSPPSPVSIDDGFLRYPMPVARKLVFPSPSKQIDSDSD